MAASALALTGYVAVGYNFKSVLGFFKEAYKNKKNRIKLGVLLRKY